MKNTLSASVIAGAMLLGAAGAHAEGLDLSGFYGRLDTGGSFSSNVKGDLGNNDAGTAAIIGAGIGYKFSPHVRADLTMGYRTGYKVSAATVISGSTLAGSAKINSFDVMANGYYDIGTYGALTPYVGGGIGLANNDVGTSNLSLGTSKFTINSHTQTSLAWQLGFGTAVKIADKLDLDVGYRYLDAGTFKTGDILTGTSVSIAGATQKGYLKAHEIQVGLRYSF